MTNEMLKLQKDLQQIVKQIPWKWTKVQNNITDNKLNIFKIDTIKELEYSTLNFDEEDKIYFKRRWFIWQCSKVDEYLFCQNSNVKANAFSKDKLYDIEFCSNEKLRFDVKGTVVPKLLINKIDELIENPVELIRFYYEQQSKGVRFGMQNRLYIVHHSFKNASREIILRCHFDYKKQVFKDYANGINSVTKFLQYKNSLTDVIFIIENKDGRFSAKWFCN